MLREYLNLFIVVYLNDILIYFKIKKNYVKQVLLVLQALKNANLKVKLGKSVFYTKKILFLEFIVTFKCLQINFKKIRFIVK